MTKSHENSRVEKLHRHDLRTTIGIGALATAVATSAAGGYMFNRLLSSEGVSASATHVAAAQEAHRMVTQYDAAISRAIHDEKAKPIHVSVVGGNVKVDSHVAGANLVTTYDHPILLATGTDAAPDATGKFLQGSYIGLQEADAEGNPTIVSIAYDKNTMTFVPDGHSKTVENLAMYPTSVDYTDGSHGHVMVAFDPAGEEFVPYGWGFAQVDK